MNSSSSVDLWNQLLKAKITSGEMPELQEMESPWYVRTMLGIAGWIAALFLLLFLATGLEIVLENEIAGLIVSLFMMGGAFAILRFVENNDFAAQFALAFSFAAQVLFVVSIAEILDPYDGVVFFAVSFMEIFLAAVIMNSIHRIWSSFAATLAFSMGLAYYSIHFVQIALLLLAVASIWLNEFRHAKYYRMLSSAGYGFTLSLIYQQSSKYFYSYIMHEFMSSEKQKMLFAPWMGEVLSGLVFLGVVYVLLKRENIKPRDPIFIVVMVSVFLLSLASLKASGIACGIVIILLGFSGGNRILIGLGISSLIFYLSTYYYMLNTTLLVKSGVLGISGIILISAMFAIRYFAKISKGVHNAE